MWRKATALRPFAAAVRPEVTPLPYAVSPLRPDSAALPYPMSALRPNGTALLRAGFRRCAPWVWRCRHGNAHDVLPRLGLDGLDAVRREDDDVLLVVTLTVARLQGW